MYIDKGSVDVQICVMSDSQRRLKPINELASPIFVIYI
jgi:hypothetical protein